MSTLNWRDFSTHSEAHSSRAVGGQYRLTRHCAQASSVGLEPTYVAVGGDPLAYNYRIEYRGSGDGNWRDVRSPRGIPGTLAEAKQMAQEDHERRMSRLATHVTDN